MNTTINYLGTTLLAFFAILAFYSCSQEECENLGSKAETIALYRAKAAEFAEKYNLRITLNEDSIGHLVEIKSIEEMEHDFMELAQIRCEESGSNSAGSPKRGKIRIRKSMSLIEDSEPKSGFFDFYIDSSQNTSLTGATGSVLWYFNGNVASYIYMDFCAPNGYCYYSTSIPADIDSYRDGVVVQAGGEYEFQGPYYCILVSCYVYYDQRRGNQQVYLNTKYAPAH